MSRFSNLDSTTSSFANMMKRFGVVTVMNAKVFDTSVLAGSASIKDYFKNKTASEVYDALKNIETEDEGLLCSLDTLKIANITTEGPTKTVNGGQYSNPLIKFGKSARLEMQDALGNNKALDALCGTISEYSDAARDSVIALHVTEDFAGPRTIVGDSFFIHQTTGRQVPVKILFYQFLPDSIFNLTQDAEGDATVFDMNGDLMTTVIKIGDKNGMAVEHGLFYSIIDENDNSAVDNSSDTPKLNSVYNMEVGDVDKIDLGVTGATATTTDNSIASVGVAGKVLTLTAEKAGRTAMTVTYSGKTYSATVVVKALPTA